MFRSSLAVVTLVSSLVSISSPAQTSCAKESTPAAIEARIDALIAQMTLDERIAQLQDDAPGIARLSLHGYHWWNEGLHGLARNGYATVFPQAIGLAATWDPALLRSVGETVSTEARAKFNQHAGSDSPRYGGLTLSAPDMNIFRDPRWGRGQETYGEDPFLTATLATSFVNGIQGDDSFYLRANATPKYFAAYSGPEESRYSSNPGTTPHDLADIYLPAFHTVMTQTNAAALMCSSNAIDGVPSCAKSALLQLRVRDLWHFKGYVVADCDAVGSITDPSHTATDQAHEAAAALSAGVDLNCGKSYLALKQALQQRLISEANINRSLHRLLLARLHLGIMDPVECSPYSKISKADLDTPEHRSVALRAAEESVVLLKNDGTLPLNAAAQSIAVIGPTADMLKVLEAGHHGTASDPITPLQGMLQSFKKVSYAQGSLLAAGLPAPVPTNALRVNAGPTGVRGLLAEYFSAASFSGNPAFTKFVDKVDLDLDGTGPDNGITSSRFAIRWSGMLVPLAAGDYTFRVNIERCSDCTAHDQFRLLIDGKVVIDNNGSRAEPDRIKLHFADASPHAIRLELVHPGEDKGSGEDKGIALEWEPPADSLINEALTVAREADVIVVFVGLPSDLEGEALPIHLDGFAGGDRKSLELPAAQQLLLHRLRDLHKKMVIVLTSGSAIALDPDKAGASALLEAWYPGEEGGHAIANVLTGRINPSGRLPVTFFRSVADLPAFDDYGMAHRTYRYFDGPVLYPFGFGLSYTHFNYSNIQFQDRTISAGQPLITRVQLTNMGDVPGTEVVELYIAPPQGPGSPRLALAATQRVTLRAGQSQELNFTIDPAQLSFVDPEGKRAIRAGNYRLFIGGNQPNPAFDAASVFTITGNQPADF